LKIYKILAKNNYDNCWVIEARRWGICAPEGICNQKRAGNRYIKNQDKDQKLVLYPKKLKFKCVLKKKKKQAQRAM